MATGLAILSVIAVCVAQGKPGSKQVTRNQPAIKSAAKPAMKAPTAKAVVKSTAKSAKKHTRHVRRRVRRHRRVSRSTHSSVSYSSSAETGLVGIKLFDDNLKLLRTFGEPDVVVPVGGGGGGGNTPAAGPAPAASSGGPATGRMRGASSGRPSGQGTAGTAEGMTGPIGDIDQGNWGSLGQSGGLLGQGPNAGQGETEDAIQGRPGGRPTGRPGAGGNPGAGTGNGGSQPVTGALGGPEFYTRWEYRRPGSQYAFILDKYGEIMQIEAIGLEDARVHTNRNVKFGTQFGEILKRYGQPDNYEFAGDQIVMNYLVNAHVAFRLNRLESNKPHVVTGMVVAAGR